VSNVLSEEKRQQVIALGRLGWPLRRIEKETGVRRETAGVYLKAANVAVRPPGGWGRRSPAKPANGVSPDSEPLEAPARAASASHCAPFLEFIELSLSKGRNAKAIWQDLVDDYGFTGRYASVKRFVRKLRGGSAVEARAVIVTPAGEEAQVDYGSGPMVRDGASGRYRRTVCSCSRWATAVKPSAS
jgi:transposase